jgi:DNA polymerase-3 subunit epsilon
VAQVIAQATYGARPRALPSRLTDAERAAHQAFVRGELKGSSLWARFEG